MKMGFHHFEDFFLSNISEIFSIISTISSYQSKNVFSSHFSPFNLYIILLIHHYFAYLPPLYNKIYGFGSHEKNISHIVVVDNDYFPNGNIRHL